MSLILTPKHPTMFTTSRAVGLVKSKPAFPTTKTVLNWLKKLKLLLAAPRLAKLR